jgi:hypothetical protein
MESIQDGWIVRHHDEHSIARLHPLIAQDGRQFLSRLQSFPIAVPSTVMIDTWILAEAFDAIEYKLSYVHGLG